MTPSSGNPGLSKLAAALQGQMQKNQEANSALILDFGEIQTDYSLLTNTYPIPIPKTDYLVCRCVSYNPAQALTSTAWPKEIQPQHAGHTHGSLGQHKHSEDVNGEHYHSVALPEKMHWIKPGDRVLVAWVQNDAIVVDKILPASQVGG